MCSMQNRIWRIISSRIYRYRSYYSYCKCSRCEDTYLKYKRRDSSVFSIRLTNQEENAYKAKGSRYLLAGFLTWLGLKKDNEEDHMVSVIKLGILNLNKKEYDKAETILHLALKLAQERQDMNAQLYIFDLLANVAFEKQDFPKAEKLFVQVTKELLAHGTPHDDNSIVEISLKLAFIYSQREEREKAETGFNFCIDIQRVKMETIDINNVDALNESEKDTALLWGMCVDWYAKHLLSTGRLKEAQINFQKALDISEKLNGSDHPQTLVLLNDVGSVYTLLMEFNLAIENFEKAIKRSKNSDSNDDVPAFYCNLGATYLQIGKVKEGEKACKTALRLAKKTGHSSMIDAEECLQEINARKIS